MKIGLFVKDFATGKKISKDGIPTKGDTEFHAENHAKQLMRLGHQVTIMAKNGIFSREQEKIWHSIRMCGELTLPIPYDH